MNEETEIAKDNIKQMEKDTNIFCICSLLFGILILTLGSLGLLK